ncbi:tetratricopeptide repeat protein [Thalassomonas viridans]|uniref:Tetratricopeptide repeat protein n=1 Tax=Thalassomonas viridans TaxID=137584 RepID=A0AAE9YYZ2_9GAMM|nr:tetratricopeptide repeat protein [Thalassomonas viridans]WDE03580.1 tetratricopeptide repeat protein [Thalassomonas viridans]
MKFQDNSILGFIMVLSLFFSGCSLTSEEKRNAQRSVDIMPLLNDQLFEPPASALLSEEDIFALSEPQQAAFLAGYRQGLARGLKPHKAVEAYITSLMGNFVYYGETYTAAQAMSREQGNCMSLAVLTTAMVRLAGLEFDYRKVNTLPIFEKKKSLLLSSSHVQTVIYDPEFVADKNILYFTKPGVVIDYFPSDSNYYASSKYGYQQFLAMFYQNLAADALLEEDFNLAFAYAQRALSADKRSNKTINLLAVLHRRMGDISAAEAIYQAGLRLNPDDIYLLSNLVVLLKKQHRFAEAEIYEQSMRLLDDPNPYAWLEQAYLAQQKQDDSEAISYFKKVIAKAPYVQEAYIGLYQIYARQGKIARAQLMLEKVLEWTHEQEERKGYKRKLYQLTGDNRAKLARL